MPTATEAGLTDYEISTWIGVFAPAGTPAAIVGLLHEKIGAMRTQLISALTAQFDKEVQKSVRRVEDALAPYTRFIKAEHEKIELSQAKLAQLQTDLLMQTAALQVSP